MKKRNVKPNKRISAAAAVATTPYQEIQEKAKAFFTIQQQLKFHLIKNLELLLMPIMCGGEPRAMLRKDRGKADNPIYTIQICIPKHVYTLDKNHLDFALWCY
ncbi:hypothetical protein Ahy_A09g046651 [Arachis hypogaea]|uniref:PIFI-like Ig-like domain-containing protein n=1 Tax=Arachis hypogaea TaxID=3818 RepID=A0A445BQD9_ARAHY|nr:hypothetical protein Ahy_A09g046651 [Arachis hypogaea]